MKEILIGAETTKYLQDVRTLEVAVRGHQVAIGSVPRRCYCEDVSREVGSTKIIQAWK